MLLHLHVNRYLRCNSHKVNRKKCSPEDLIYDLFVKGNPS